MYKSCTKLQQNGSIYHSLTPQKILMSNINLKVVTAEQIHQIQLLKQAEYFTSLTKKETEPPEQIHQSHLFKQAAYFTV
jgi:hypothetical protein